MAWKIITGAAAGAAGTTALNAATYLDMAVRGRGTSSAPQDLVEKVAEKAGVSIPGSGDQRENRLQGLGPLFGAAVGVGVGCVAAALHHALSNRGKHLPAALEVVVISAAAMALSDVPLKVLGISDPADWAPVDWAADAIPHLVYGAVTYGVITAAHS